MERNAKKNDTSKNNKFRGNRKGASRKNSNDSRDIKPDNKDRGVTLTNNPAWYAESEGVIEQYTRLSDNIIAGRPLKLGTSNFAQRNICVIPMSINIKADPNESYVDPVTYTGINAGIRKLYQEMTAFTGRAASNYSASDIGILITCLGSLVEMASFIRRTFGMFKLYNAMDRSYPKAIVQAMGIDYDKDAKNIADMIKRFNTLIARMGSVLIPMNTFIAKCIQMYDNIYLDNATPMSEIMIPVPSGFLYLDETTQSTGSVARYVSYDWFRIKPTGQTSSASLDDYLTDFEKQIDSLLTSSTMAIVFADLLNYASKKSLNFFTIQPMEFEYIAPVVYSDEFNMQLHNARWYGEYVNSDAGSIFSSAASDVIYQSGLIRLSTPNGTKRWDASHGPKTVVSVSSNSNALLDFNIPNPTPDMLVEATRYAMIGNAELKTVLVDVDLFVQTNAYSGGDHIINCMIFFAVGSDNAIYTRRVIPTNVRLFDDPAEITPVSDLDALLSTLSRFTSAPFIYGYSTASANVSHLHGDMSYYKTYDETYLSTLNDRILQYMFSVI